MKAVIPCGRRRLNEFTDYIPKPLVEIVERPILWHIMKMTYRKVYITKKIKKEYVKFNYPLL